MKIYYLTPFISAFIGYITNYVAIIMLFRPYNDIKIGKIKLFSKGVVPKNHKKLADKIGMTVSNELIATKDFMDKINSDKIQIILRRSIRKIIDEIINKDQPSLKELIPTGLGEIWDKFISKVAGKMELHFEQMLKSSSTQENISKSVEDFIRRNKDTSILEIFSSYPKIVDKIDSSLIELITNSLQQEELALEIQALLRKETFNLFNSNKTISELIPNEIEPLITSHLPLIKNEIISEIRVMLKDEQNQVKIKKILVQSLMQTLQDSPDLGMFSSFISENFIEKQVNVMAEKGFMMLDDYLISDEISEKINNTIQIKYLALINKPVKEIIGNLKSSQIEQAIVTISDLVLKASKQEKTKEVITPIVKNIVRSSLSKTPEELFLKDDTSIKEISTFISNEINLWLQNSDLHQTLQKLVLSQINYYYEYPIGRLSKWIPKKIVNHSEDVLVEKINLIMNDKLPEIIENIDIKSIVQEKVESFPLPKLEKIIRSVANKELNYITIFGGILGLIIGLIQLLLIQLS